MLPPPFPPFYSSTVSRPRVPSQNKLLVVVVVFVFVLLDIAAARAVHGELIAGICELRFCEDMSITGLARLSTLLCAWPL